MPCHDDATAIPANHQQSTMNVDEKCCEDLCLCDDSNCHGTSIVFEHSASIFYHRAQMTSFHKSLYLSLKSSPKSPPPIL